MAFRSRTPLHRLPVFPVLLMQVAMTLFVAIIFFLVRGMVAGYSGLAGGLIALVPNVYFTAKAFRYFGARSASSVVISIWAGEMGKWILTVALFALVFMSLKQVDLLALFTGYVLVLICSAAALWLVKGFVKR